MEPDLNSELDCYVCFRTGLLKYQSLVSPWFCTDLFKKLVLMSTYYYKENFEDLHDIPYLK